MPSLEMARRISATAINNAKTIGQLHKENADFLMEYTWDNDIQSRICYIYDYKHDDSPNLNEGMVYGDETTKTMIEAKFIITSYGSVDKDQVAYHLMFKPSQKVRFEDGDDLYYFETDYKGKFDTTFPISLYVDIPDDRGVYHRWMIVDFEEANQFVKYVVLPCDYKFQWIDVQETKRYKRNMWCCTRAMNSYTTGEFRDRYILSLDDVNKVWLPLNDLTQNVSYLDKNGKGIRVIVSAKTPYPLTWLISKVENTKPIGIIKVTLDQDEFNPRTDFIEKDNNGNIIGMYADYYSVDLNNPIDVDPEPQPITDVKCDISCSSSTIKVGGSYRTFTATYTDVNGNDVSEEYATYSHEWRFFLGDQNGTRIDDVVEVKQDENPNIIKVKFPNKREYLNQYLFIDLYTNAYVYGSTGQTVTIIG